MGFPEITCIVVIVLCVLGVATKKQVADCLGPKPNSHPFSNVFRTLFSMYWFVLGEVTCFVVGGFAAVILWGLLK